MRRLNEGLTRRPWLVLLVLALATVPFVWGAMHARVANPLEGWFVRGDPVLADYRAFLERFGNDEVVLVAVHSADGVFVPSTLRSVESATQSLAQVEHIRSVLSISTVRIIEPDTEGPRAHELGARYPLTSTDPAVVRGRLRMDAVSWEALVSGDEKTTLLYTVPDVLEDDSVRTAFLAEIRETLDRELDGTGLEYRLAGSGVVFDAINEASAQDISRVFLPAAIVATILLFLALRSVVRVLVALLAAGLATTWAIGLFGLTDVPINLVTTTVPTIVAVISMANAIHLLRDAPAAEGASAGSFFLSPVVRACFFSALTSAAAFVALTASDIQVLRELGGYTAAGIMASFVVSVLICFPLGNILSRRFPAVKHERVGNWLGRVGEGIIRRRAVVFAVVGVAAIAALVGCFRLRIDTYSLGFLPEDHAVRQDSEWIEEHWGYYWPIMFEVTGSEGDFAEPDMVAKLLEFQTALGAHPDIGGTQALPDLFRSGVEGGEPRVPDDPALVRQTVETLRALLGADAMEPLVDASYSQAHVSGRVRMQNASSLAATIDDAIRRGEDAFGSRVMIKAVGYLPLYVKLTRYLGTSFVKSLPLVIGLNFVLLLILLRSFRWAALATPSNILPVFLLLGAMGWLGVRLDVATVSIACVAFGILVDDTIHLLVHSQLGIRNGLSRKEAVLAALRRGGSAITWTTVVLVGGFGTFLLAQVVPVRYFGSLLSSTLVVGLICDIMLVTAIVSIRSRD